MPRGKSSGDYEGWLLRMLDSAEDLRYAQDEEEWLMFCVDKIRGEFPDAPITMSQVDAVEEMRERALAIQHEFGVVATQEFEGLRGDIKHRYRLDASMAKEFGQRAGTYVAAWKVEARIEELIDSRLQIAKEAARVRGD